tara:strand:- start:261 stop:470 length:210 start_codon:yes stop_codon:yes gene_type:complete
MKAHLLKEVDGEQPSNFMSRKRHILCLKEEIELLRSRIEPHDTGHLYTTIGTLEHRIEELSDNKNNPYE